MYRLASSARAASRLASVSASRVAAVPRRAMGGGGHGHATPKCAFSSPQTLCAFPPHAARAPSAPRTCPRQWVPAHFDATRFGSRCNKARTTSEHIFSPLLPPPFPLKQTRALKQLRASTCPKIITCVFLRAGCARLRAEGGEGVWGGGGGAEGVWCGSSSVREAGGWAEPF